MTLTRNTLRCQSYKSFFRHFRHFNTSDDSSSTSDEYGDVDEATTVQFQDLRQVRTCAEYLDEGNNGNTRDDNVHGSREKYSVPRTRKISYLTARYSATKSAIVL